MLYLLFLFLSLSTTCDFGPTFSQKVAQPFSKVDLDLAQPFSKVDLDLAQPFSKVDCINEKGKPVDYWVAIKKPQGTDYFYYDSEEKVFETSLHSLNETTNGALAHTVKQLWQKDVNYVIYNDQPPTTMYNDNFADFDFEVASKFGHTKGLFAFAAAAAAGFWLTHSIPLFPLGPKNTDHYSGLGSNAKIYAQNMLCVSMSIASLNDLAKLFLLNKPQIYDAYIQNVDTNDNEYDYIKQLVDGKYSTVKQCDSSILKTEAGRPIKVYAKTAEWNNDLYAGCVTVEEQDTLLVETWIRGKAEGPSCPLSDYNTLDIHQLSFVVGSSIDSRDSWPETQDHSKWAITETKNIVCMGDINRMTTQYLRGGGTACFSDPVLHAILKAAIIKTNTCEI
uniref:Uncharacterized protein n=1 Tax=viral metagenome TaxID=1070528 RepID=A0A6C0HFX0_9ZZZZ